LFLLTPRRQQGQCRYSYTHI